MTGFSFRYFAFAGLLAAGSLIVSVSGASSTPVATGVASSGFADIARGASKITEVRRRGRGLRRGGRGWRRGGRGWRRGGRGWRRGFRGGPYLGFGAPFYYGGFYPYYGYYPYDYYDDYYYQPPVRRVYRGSRSCRRVHRACVRRWGYGGANYRGCMRYDRCRAR